jgi:hypothetical protein
MSEGLIRDLEALRDRIRPYDNGRGEGEYFADELDELIKAWKPILGEARKSSADSVLAALRWAERTSGGDVAVMIAAGINEALSDHKSHYGASEGPDHSVDACLSFDGARCPRCQTLNDAVLAPHNADSARCPAHGEHPHNGMTCLDCPICRPPRNAVDGVPRAGADHTGHAHPATSDAVEACEIHGYASAGDPAPTRKAGDL